MYIKLWTHSKWGWHKGVLGKTMIENEINNILKSWNPLDVPEFITEDEYKSYIKNILNCIHEGKNLGTFLIDLLENKMGLIARDKSEISKVAEKIMGVVFFLNAMQQKNSSFHK